MLLVVFLLILLFLGTAFTSLAELSISSVNPLRIKGLAEKGVPSARAVLWIRSRPDLLFGSLLVANTIINVIIPVLILRLLASVITNASTREVDLAAVIVATFFISLLEVTAKTLGTARAEKMALLTALPVRVVIVILYPFVNFFIFLSNRMIRLFGVDPKFEGDRTSLDEVRLAIRSAAEQGHMDLEEQKMLHRLSWFGSLTARDALVPRGDIIAFPRNMTCREAARRITTLPYSRYPVYGESLDDIAGVLHARDLLVCSEVGDLIILHDILYPALFVPLSAPLKEVLDLMRENRVHMVIVVDEYGQTAGLITFEDIVEEIIGEVFDEFDPETIPLRRESDGRVTADGRVSVRVLNDEFGFNFPTSAVTLGGVILHHLGRLPEEGETFEIEGARVKVVTVSGRRIRKVVIERLDDAGAENGAQGE